MNNMWRITLALIGLSVTVAITLPYVAEGAVKSASTDGEATVYLAGNFTANFDVAYRAVLKPGPRNKSWTSLGILLVGTQIPGPGAFVGLSSDPKTHAVTPYTYVDFPRQGQFEYKKQFGKCDAQCIIELRGDRARIFASINNSVVASWSRSDLYLQHPSIQINAQAHGTGDSIEASLIPMRTTAHGRALNPTCAFTTRGIEPVGLSTLRFTGTTNDGLGEFVNLSTGTHADKC